MTKKWDSPETDNSSQNYNINYHSVDYQMTGHDEGKSETLSTEKITSTEVPSLKAQESEEPVLVLEDKEEALHRDDPENHSHNDEHRGHHGGHHHSSGHHGSHHHHNHHHHGSGHHHGSRHHHSNSRHHSRRGIFGSRRRKRKYKKRKGSFIGTIFKSILMILVLLLVGGIGSVAYMRYHGKKVAMEHVESTEEIKVADKAITENGGKTVTYKGQEYEYNQSISTIVFLGVDKEELEEDATAGTAGQADTIIVAAINNSTGAVKMIPISRSTMTEIDEYAVDGTYVGRNKAQITLAYAYGDGREQSCKNVAEAVSRVLYGMPINRYVSIDYNCIKKLNDEVGGVEVEVLDSMTERYPELEKGNVVTLDGERALAYLRHRDTVIKEGQENVDNNAPRMARQKQYLNALMKKIMAMIKKNPAVALDLYRDMGDDMVTDVSTSEIVYYSSFFAKKGLDNEILSIPGSVKHNKYTEFYPDKDALYELILDTFYLKK